MRLTLAKAFERHGMIANAVAILQTLPSLEPLLGLLERHKEMDGIETAIWSGTGGYMTGLEFAILHENALEYPDVPL